MYETLSLLDRCLTTCFEHIYKISAVKSIKTVARFCRPFPLPLPHPEIGGLHRTRNYEWK